MKALSPITRLKQRGQTLIIALIVLFVLLLLGFVFLGILNRNIIQSDTARQRSLSSDLADAGIRYAHDQLVNSILGADWRLPPTPPLNSFAPGTGHPNPYPGDNTLLLTNDPDIFYLRPAPLNAPPSTGTPGFKLRATDALPDLGGPDGLGPFSRVQFRFGRALIRVRFAPSDVDITNSNPAGPLLQPGKTHSYIVIESIGRPGALNATDPTTLTSPAGQPSDVAYQFFQNQTDLQSAVSLMSDRDNQFVHSRKLIAFASIGLTDNALFITNKDHATRSADIGNPYETGANEFDDQDSTVHDVHVPMQLGGQVKAGSTSYTGQGSIYSNANLTIHGMLEVSLNLALGEGIFVAGNITGAGSIKNPANTATLTMHVFNGTTNAFTTDPVLTTGAGLDSSSVGFSTELGSYRDGDAGVDTSGNPRAIPYKTPPSLMTVDPSTATNRYRAGTRDSGQILAGGNSGQYGHGRDVYVNNPGDLQTQSDATGRLVSGAEDALYYDWLNPNNGQPNSAWLGQYYVPPGCYVQLEPDGFIITRSGNAPIGEKTWHNPDGTDTPLTSIRYRIEPNTATPHIINTLTPNVNIDDPSPAYSSGPLFDGVLFFEGNVRIRGVIPTNRQLTIVSMGNIYVEGSITKGVQDPSSGSLLTMPSTSALALLAEDYVVINTTQFFGPGTNQVVEKSSGPNPTGYNPVVMPAAGGVLDLMAEFLLDPDSAPANVPNTWVPFAQEYIQAGATSGGQINPYMLISQTMDDGPASNALESLAVNQGATVNPDYLYPSTGTSVYQLGGDSWQRSPSFETRGFPFLKMPPDAQVANQGIINTSAFGAYQVNLQRNTPFEFKSTNQGMNPTNDILTARTTIVPHDIRIEAVLFAEQGSFFVIPGNWFNPNPNDRRDEYQGTGATDAERQLNRLRNFGNYPEAPFYGEPVDVRITIIGAVSENMPPPISQQTEYLKKWGWIPRMHGASGELIPANHEPTGFDVSDSSKPADEYLYVPNLTIKYDPMLASGRVNGFVTASANPGIRPNPNDPTQLTILPPLPRLPVSPTLFYFGEVNP
jgi:hypothetical protein